MNELLVVWLSLSLSGSLVALTILLLKPLFRRFGRTWQYYIWLLVILRLLIPISPKVSMIGGLFQQAESHMLTGITATIHTQERSTGDSLQVIKEPDGKKEGTRETLPVKSYLSVMGNHVLGAVWLITAVILLIRKIFGYVQFVRTVKRESTIIVEGRLPAVLRKVSSQMRIKKKITIAVNSLVMAPMLIGIRKPMVVLPPRAVSEEELTYICRHELTHFYRKDFLYKWASEIAVCLHWFNPVVYLVRKQINKDCEFSCDEKVISRLDEKERKTYGDTLLDTIVIRNRSKSNIVSLSLNADGKLIKERLSAIMKYKQKSKGILFTAAVLTAVLTCGSIFSGAYTVAAAENKKTNVSEKANPIRIGSIDIAKGGKVSLGSQKLLSGTKCTALFTWSGQDELTVVCTSSKGTGTSYPIKNGKETSFEIDADGDYTIAVKNETANTIKEVNGSISFSPQAPAGKPQSTPAPARIDGAAQTVEYKSVEMMRYEDEPEYGVVGHPYVHDIRTNNTDKNIVNTQRGMMAFDKDGNPLIISWNGMDSSEKPSHYFLYDWGEEEIEPSQTEDIPGGWSLNIYGTDENVAKIAYVLYCDKEITFEDGTVWQNPEFENWLDTYEGEKVDVKVLGSYYPYIQNITF